MNIDVGKLFFMSLSLIVGCVVLINKPSKNCFQNKIKKLFIFADV